MTLPCAARSTLVYLERGDAPRCTKALSPFNQTSWLEMWCPGVILGPSNTQLRVSECLMWGYNMFFSQLNGDPCPAWTTERGKLKRGWSPGDSLNLVRVLSVRVNYSQQCRNDINGRWEYSKSIIDDFLSRVTLKFARWPWKTIGRLVYAASSFEHHFIAIIGFKLETSNLVKIDGVF